MENTELSVAVAKLETSFTYIKDSLDDLKVLMGELSKDNRVDFDKLEDKINKLESRVDVVEKKESFLSGKLSGITTVLLVIYTIVKDFFFKS